MRQCRLTCKSHGSDYPSYSLYCKPRDSYLYAVEIVFIFLTCTVADVKEDAVMTDDEADTEAAVNRENELGNVKGQLSSEGGRDGGRPWERRRSSRLNRRGRGSIRSVRLEGEGVEALQPPRDSDDESMYSFRAGYGLDQIAMLSDSGSDEFFDARGEYLQCLHVHHSHSVNPSQNQ